LLAVTLNPYDQCVANCDIDGKQCTIGWYIDDTKISHEDPTVVSMIIDQLEAKFGKMTVVQGDEHVFLGMNIRYNRTARTATITMKDYLREAIEESGLDITRTAITPAGKDLFEISDTAEPLSNEKANVFHSVTAKHQGTYGPAPCHKLPNNTIVQEHSARFKQTTATIRIRARQPRRRIHRWRGRPG
jgi:hypothetical protein